MKCRRGSEYLLNEMERGHPVRRRAKLAQVYAKHASGRSVRAARSGGQDVRAPTVCRVAGLLMCDRNIALLRGAEMNLTVRGL